MKRIFLLFVSFMCLLQFGYSQKVTITGKVTTKEEGTPVIGASVMEKGTTNGTVTNFEGAYSISVSTNSILVYSYIGTEKVERKISGSAVLNVVLNSDAVAIDEVVVTAMGIKSEKKKLNFAVQSINSDDLIKDRSANFVNSLQGKVAGISVTNAGGSPNSGSQVIIRGISSINPAQNNEPLYIVDGMQVSRGGSDINPNDIANITVLKGAAASALYGQEAANGVIMITTKNGSEGKVKVNLNSSWQFDNAVRVPQIQSMYGPGASGFYKDQTGGGWGPPLQPGENKYDNVGNFLGTGFYHKYDVSASGGTNNFTSYASATYSNNQGVVPNDFLNKIGLLVKGTYIASKNLTINMMANIVNNKSRGFGAAMSPIYNWPTGQGLMTSSSGTLVNGKTTGLVVKNNIITAQGRCGWFYYINGGDFFGNEIHLTQLGSSATTNYGLWTSTGALGTFNIYNNKFLEVTTMETAASGTLGMRALSLAAGTYNVYNNYFAGMDRKAVAAGSVNQTYVFFGGTSGYINNNTFYMPPLTAKTTPGYYQAITLSYSNPVIKNNIFISNEDGVANAFYGTVSTGSIDYNVYFNRAGNTKSLFVSGTTTSTFAAYQTANPTKDINSKNVDVNFVSATDLTLTGVSVGDYNLAVPRISPVLTDIAGTSRPTVTYAGAFEASALTAVAKQFTVTVPNGTPKVYIAGTFTGKAWDITTPFELIPTGTANQFSGIFPCVDGVQYKYLCEKTGDWDYAEAVYDGGNAPLLGSNRTYNAADNVPIWFRVNKIIFNVSFAPLSVVPSQLFVKGGFNGWATGIEMTKTANTFSTTLGGNVGDKFPANTEYKYYTNDMVTDNWESDATGGYTGNRWAIAPIMNDVVARFTTLIITKVNEVETSARIMRTNSGIEIIVESESTIELYGINGVLIDKTNVNGSYSHDLNNGIYIVRVNGKATKFVK